MTKFEFTNQIRMTNAPMTKRGQLIRTFVIREFVIDS